MLLALKLLYSSHTSVNMAQLVIHVIQCYSIYKLLSYCVIDNAPDNDTTLREISKQLLSNKAVLQDADKYRLRYFSHVVSLIANAFTSNKPLKAACTAKALKGTPKADKPIQKRLLDAITKLYKIIVFAMRTLARAQEQESYIKQALNDFLYLIKDNNTRQFSIYIMLVRAITFKDIIIIFTAANMTADKDGKNLLKCIMSREDQLYYFNVIAFIKPLFLLVKELEGKPQFKANSYISDILLAYDYIALHIKDQLIAFDT